MKLGPGKAVIQYNYICNLALYWMTICFLCWYFEW